MALPQGRFTYEPLDYQSPSIRLLELQPIQPNCHEHGSVQCTLFHATLEAQYTCLSYMWGPETPSAIILINGKELHIRQNLFDFLMVARTLQDAPKVYWIDAVCIDQENVAERNHQVHQMGEIYAKATEVISWLGTCDTLTSVLPRFVEVIAEPFHRRFLDDKSEFYRRLYKIRKIILEKKPEFRRHLFDNPYWRRAWITQEIQLARQCTILLGSTRIPLKALMMDSESLALHQLFGPIALKPQRWRSMHWTNASYTKPLTHLLVAFGDRECSVPQDRVFSLLSLCEEREAIVVDYELPRSDLMLNVLNCHPDRLCICSAFLIARTLELIDAPLSTADSQEQFPWLSINMDPGHQHLTPDYPLQTQSCTFKIEKMSPAAGYDTYHKDPIWMVRISLLDGPERVIYWGEKCTIDMPVRYTKAGRDGGEEEHRVLCNYGEGIDLSARDNESGKLMLRIAFKVWTEIARDIGNTLCMGAVYGRRSPQFRDIGLPEISIGYPGRGKPERKSHSYAPT